MAATESIPTRLARETCERLAAEAGTVTDVGDREIILMRATRAMIDYDISRLEDETFGIEIRDKVHLEMQSPDWRPPKIRWDLVKGSD